jgi:hypothetical protein
MPPPSQFVFDERFVEAFYPRLPGSQCHRVFGRRLRPFCFWHKLQLELLDSPLITGGPVSLFDLDVATRICRTRYRERVTLPKVSTWNKWTWPLRLRGNLAREAKKFEEYLGDYYSPPKFWPKDGGEDNPQLDESLHFVLMVVKATGWPQEYVWEMPIGEVQWITAGLQVLEGAECLIWTPLDEEAFQRHQARKKEWVKNRIIELMKGGMAKDGAVQQATAEMAEQTAENTLAVDLVKKGLGPEAAQKEAKLIRAELRKQAEAEAAAKAAAQASQTPAPAPDAPGAPPSPTPPPPAC